MHIVFIVGSYYPNYSAVGKCVGNVADYISKSHKVTVICQRNISDEENECRYNNQRLIRVITRDKTIRNKLDIKAREDNCKIKKIYSNLLNLYKLAILIKTVLSKCSINKDLVSKYVQALKHIKEPIDVIVTASMPFESVLSAVKYKESYDNNVKVVPYLFDQFVDSDTLHRFSLNKNIKRKWHLELEKKALKNTDLILAMYSLKTHFRSDLPGVKNIKYIEHPLIINSRTTESVNKNGIKISYIGGLYKNYVTPEYLLKLFSKTNIEQAVLNFFIIGNCTEIVEDYAKKMPQAIINHGSVDKQTASNQISDSNILISIAEVKGIQMSSKIFEYMSYGKPIIHFYSVDNDVNLKILKKYPLALCLKQDNSVLYENITAFESFCKKNYDTIIPFEDVENLYLDASPKFTASLLENIGFQYKD